jgi:hypothetical protein
MNASEVAHAIHGLPQGRHEFIFHPRSTQDDPDFKALIDLRRRVSRDQ